MAKYSGGEVSSATKGRGVNANSSDGRGRGRGRGRGHGFGTGRDKSHIKCFNCDLYGHFASECKNKKQEEEAHLAQTQEEDPALLLEDPTLLLAMNIELGKLVLLNEDKVELQLRADGEAYVSSYMWYFNNGTSNHMSGQ